MQNSSKSFDDELHCMTLSDDGSYTAFSKEYDEHYHSTKDGALHESLIKHVIPAFKLQKDKDEITILDICFGLGFNTLATLFYAKENFPHAKINIYSPELDEDLVNSLDDFIYPKEFVVLTIIISSLIKDGVYDNEVWHVELFLGDASKYRKQF